MKFSQIVLSCALLITLPSLLAACSDESSSSSTESAQSPEVLTKPESQDRAIVEPQNNPQEKRKPLDLSLPEEDLSKSISDNDIDDKQQPQNQQKLPDLFAAGKEEDDLSIDGGVLRDDTNPDLMDSVQGAEVSIEMKTN